MMMLYFCSMFFTLFNRLDSQTILSNVALSHQCVAKCMEKFGSLINQRKVAFEKHLMISNLTDSETGAIEHMTNLCSLYDKHKKCLSACPPHALSTVAQIGLKTGRVLCERKNFTQYVSCLSKNEMNIRKFCEVQLNDTLMAIQLVRELIMLNRQQFLPQIAAILCSNATSLIDCISTIPDEPCEGSDPIFAIQEMVAATFDNYEKFKISDQPPFSCQNLLKNFEISRISPEIEDALKTFMIEGKQIIEDNWIWYLIVILVLLIVSAVFIAVK